MKKIAGKFWAATLLMLLSLSITTGAIAKSRVMDRIDAGFGEEENRISIFFNVPVRVVSDLVNSARNEIAIRVKPVVTPGTEEEFLAGDETLSWKPSAEIPLERVVFTGQLIGNSTMLLSFSTSIGEYEITQGKGFFSISVVLKKEKKVESIKLEEPKGRVLFDVPPTEIPAVSELPAEVVQPGGKPQFVDGDFALNLHSQQQPIDFKKVAPVPVPTGRRLYTTQTEVNNQQWYRLRLGFFRSAAEAERFKKEIRHFYPNSWVDRASAEEKSRIQRDTGAPPEAGEAPLMLPKQEMKPVPERLARMMEKAREIMTAKDYPKAIRMLTAILEEPDNLFAKEALELLGLARERNGQIAHAKAEYRRYLEQYPEGSDSVRVNQRLVGLISAAEQPKEKLREPTRAVAAEREAEWEIFGSFFQSYQRDGIESDFVDDDESVTRSQVNNSIDLSVRRSSADVDMRLQLNGSYDIDLLGNGSGNQEALTDAFFEVERRAEGVVGRFGRQRFRSSGILNRFDGGVIGYQFSEDIRLNVYSGIPVEKSSDVFIRDDKWFVGGNAELASLFYDIDITLFAIEQRVDHLVDRRAVGGEARYFDDQRSFFGLVDYDIFHNRLTTFLAQTNWTLNSDTQLYFNYDYRTSPILTTFNALQGQTLETIDELGQTYTDDEIYALAEDRSARSHVVSLGGTRSLAEDFQLSGDLTISNVGDTPASGGVEATPSTGNEFFYTLQILKNNLLKEGDIGILSLRYSDASTSDTFSISANSRYPITNLWRVNPRLNLSYRNNDDGGTRITAGGTLQADYRFRSDLVFEVEGGGNWHKEETLLSTDSFLDYFFTLGYRWSF